jgi:hypothetical protein
LEEVTLAWIEGRKQVRLCRTCPAQPDLRFNAAVADADAEGEGEGFDVGEAGGFHHFLHRFSGDEGVDGLGEVFVGAGFVAADPGGGAGEDFGEVEVVEGAEEFGWWAARIRE